MSMDLVIFGAGDIAQLAHFYLTRDSAYRPVAFTVDGAYVKESTFEGLPVVPFEEITSKFSPAENSMFVALSYSQVNQLRAAKYKEAKAKGLNRTEGKTYIVKDADILHILASS